MLQLLTREATAGANPNRSTRPTLSLTWELDPQTGKPVGRWIVEGAAQASLALAPAA